jgi:tetratricopeptide (TPR) repeat protein
MKLIGQTSLVLIFNVLAHAAAASDVQTAALPIPKNDLVARMSQAVQSKDWYQGEKLATAAITAGGLTANEKSAALNNLCVSQSLKRAYADAAETCSQAVALTPARESAYVNRGNLYAKMGKPSLARADYAKAKELNPSSTLAERNLTALRWNEEHHYVALVPIY